MWIIALFNLKPGVRPEDYEAWAARRDLPRVRALPSVRAFDVLAVTGVLIGPAPPPFAYVEIIEVTDLAAFGADAASAAVQELAAEFAAYADNPVFLTTRALEAAA